MKLGFFIIALHSFAAWASVAEPTVAWNKKQVSLCWGTWDEAQNIPKLLDYWNGKLQPEMFILPLPSLRNSLRLAAESEFKTAETGISYVGWKLCKDDPKADVVLLYSLASTLPFIGYPAIATIGQDEGPITAPYTRSGHPSPRYLHLTNQRSRNMRLSAEDSLHRDFLHELGHVAGLRHEHARIEAALDPSCLSSNHWYWNLREPFYPTTFIFGPYDPSSLMNSCRTSLLTLNSLVFPQGNIPCANFADVRVNNLYQIRFRRMVRAKISLSLGDRHALRCLYSYTGDEYQRLCQPAYVPPGTTCVTR